MKKIILGSLISCLFLFGESIEEKQKRMEAKNFELMSSIKSQTTINELHKSSKGFDLKQSDQVIKEALNKEKQDDFSFMEQKPTQEMMDIASSIDKNTKSGITRQNIDKSIDYILDDKAFNFQEELDKMPLKTKQMLADIRANKGAISNNQFLDKNEKLFVVISSSMPISTIQNYFRSVEHIKTDVYFVMRGLVGNDPRYMMPTLNFLNSVATKKANTDSNKAEYFDINLDINPKVTSRFNIKHAPAVLFIKNYNPVIEQASNVIGIPDSNESYFIAYGETSLEYALKKINEEAKNKGLDNLIANMYGKGFFK